MEELKRSQERHSDELSRLKLRESQSSTDDLTARICELQERVNFMKGSRKFQEVDSAMQWKIVSRSQFTGSNFKPSWCAELRTKHAARRKKVIRKVHRETCSTIHLHQPTQCLHLMEEFLSPVRKVLRMVTRRN